MPNLPAPSTDAAQVYAGSIYSSLTGKGLASPQDVSPNAAVPPGTMPPVDTPLNIWWALRYAHALAEAITADRPALTVVNPADLPYICAAARIAGEIVLQQETPKFAADAAGAYDAVPDPTAFGAFAARVWSLVDSVIGQGMYATCPSAGTTAPDIVEEIDLSAPPGGPVILTADQMNRKVWIPANDGFDLGPPVNVTPSLVFLPSIGASPLPLGTTVILSTPRMGAEIGVSDYVHQYPRSGPFIPGSYPPIFLQIAAQNDERLELVEGGGGPPPLSPLIEVGDAGGGDEPTTGYFEVMLRVMYFGAIDNLGWSIVNSQDNLRNENQEV